jgi:MGT family glycosyltransferase
MTQRFLFVVLEGGGNSPPVLSLARRLAARGHEVRVLGDPALAEDARKQGLTLVPFQHAPHHNFRSREHDRVRDWAAPNPLRALQRVTAEVMFEPAHAYARDVLQQLEQFAADVVVVDYMILGAALGAEKAGVPSALLMHMPYAYPADHVPPFGLGFLPARGPLSRARDWILHALSRAWFEHLGRASINRARVALGLVPLASVFEQPSRSERVLVMTAAEFDFASRGPLPDNVRYVGPGLDDPAWTAPYAPELSASDAPLVVVGLGSTFQNQGPLTARVIEALAGLPVRGLVTLGDVFEPAELPAAANVQVVRSAPHSSVFPHARAVIAHGGHGTVMKALSHGLPVLCLPMGRDQNDNAARVFASGAGLRLAPSASTAQIRAAIAQLLQEPAFAAAARRMAGAIACYQREDVAVRELEELARRRNLRAVA